MSEMSRNTISGFGERIRKNFAFVEAAQQEGQDVHVVTQLLASALGLLVFPYQYLKDNNMLATSSVPDELKYSLEQWSITLGSSKNFFDHLRHVRNAVAHGRIVFDSESRILDEVEITFQDKYENEPAPNWSATINARDLKNFVIAFAEFVDNRIS